MPVLYCMMETPEPCYECGGGIDKVKLLRILGPDEKKMGEIADYIGNNWRHNPSSGENQSKNPEEALQNVGAKANDAAEKGSQLEGMLKNLRVEEKEYFVNRGVYKSPDVFRKKPSDMITYSQLSRKKEFRELIEAERKRANLVIDRVFSR
jgi:hypothetical protein